MRQREAGQAFILVLIILAIGALVVIPALRLTNTVLQSNQAITQRNKGLYACEAAQEKILWMLYNDIDGVVSETLIADGDSIAFTVDVCGTIVYAGITMRAVEGLGGITLATEHVIKPTKTVDPDTILNDTYRVCTYTIRLEQLSDNNTQGLDAIYDILPVAFNEGDYQTGSSEIRVDGGSWESLDDPSYAVVGGQVRLRWPASGNFTSPIRVFDVREVKELKFKMAHEFKGEDKDRVHCNWVVLKPWDTVSGPQSPLNVGSPVEAGVCDDGGLLEVGKASNPEVIQPGVETEIEYTISITNKDGETHQLKELTDYLPPDFYYSVNSTSGITTAEPVVDLETINGVDRYELYWAFSPPVSILSGDTETLTLRAWATKDVSGSYYNEVLAIPDVPVPQIFQDIGVSDEEYYSCYSWNSGAVIVPAYDASTGAEGENITANIGFELDQVRIISWHAN